MCEELCPACSGHCEEDHDGTLNKRVHGHEYRFVQSRYAPQPHVMVKVEHKWADVAAGGI